MASWRIDTSRAVLAGDLMAELTRECGEYLRLNSPTTAGVNGFRSLDKPRYQVLCKSMSAAIAAAQAIGQTLPQGARVRASLAGQLAESAGQEIEHAISVSVNQIGTTMDRRAVASDLEEHASSTLLDAISAESERP